MGKKVITQFIILFTVFSTVTFAEMSSDEFILSISVMDSTGSTKRSDNFILLDAVGQPTPVGPSARNDFILEAGFIYGTSFSMPLDKTITSVIGGLEDLLSDPKLTLSNQEKKKIGMAIKFLEDALAAWALHEAGDPDALANALNKTKSAINKLIDSGVDTEVHQKMLAQASELAVTGEINNIASIATGGESNPNIVQARIFLSDGSAEMQSVVYNAAVQSFTQAYNEALLAA